MLTTLYLTPYNLNSLYCSFAIDSFLKETKGILYQINIEYFNTF